MNESEQAIARDELAITVEMGDAFEPGSRTAAALTELMDALNEEHGEEVSGFNFEKPDALRNFSFMSSPQRDRQGFYEGWPSKWIKAGFDGKGNDQ